MLDHSPPGIRNNNPGNIRANSSFTWLGQIGVDERGFCIFSTLHFGLRAMAKLLRMYQHTYKLNDVRGIITRWAPATENATEAYIQDVCKRMGVNDTAFLLLDGDQTCINLMKAIIYHENGEQPFDDKEFTDVMARYNVDGVTDIRT